MRKACSKEGMEAMTPEAKGLKLTGIATLFVGLAIAVIGIILCVMDFDPTDLLPLGAGALDTFIGADSARKANVPSTAKAVVIPSIIIGLICVIGAFVAHFVGAPLATILACVSAGIFAACVSLNAQRIVKALEKI